MCGTLTMASRQGILAYESVLCKITVGCRTILNTVYVADIADRAILGLPAMRQFECMLTVEDVKMIIIETENIVHRFQKLTLRSIIATSKIMIPARSEAIIIGKTPGKINGQAVLMNDKKREENEETNLLVARIASLESSNQCGFTI